MAKAYDNVSWSFIYLVPRKMGFGELIIDMVWRIMTNNWYSMIVNGARYHFFHSTRSFKQSEPLSPALFILGVEVPLRLLMVYIWTLTFLASICNIMVPKINHLSFAYDVIIFTSRRKASLYLIMKTLKVYEDISGQLINRDKSSFMVPSYAFRDIVNRIKRITSFSKKKAFYLSWLSSIHWEVKGDILA